MLLGQIQGKLRFKRQIRREFILMLDQRQGLPKFLLMKVSSGRY
jgi:hypothetical protein